MAIDNCNSNHKINGNSKSIGSLNENFYLSFIIKTKLLKNNEQPFKKNLPQNCFLENKNRKKLRGWVAECLGSVLRTPVHKKSSLLSGNINKTGSDKVSRTTQSLPKSKISCLRFVKMAKNWCASNLNFTSLADPATYIQAYQIFSA